MYNTELTQICANLEGREGYLRNSRLQTHNRRGKRDLFAQFRLTGELKVGKMKARKGERTIFSFLKDIKGKAGNFIGRNADQLAGKHMNW